MTQNVFYMFIHKKSLTQTTCFILKALQKFCSKIVFFKFSDPTYISAKEQRRLDRQELRAMLKTEMVLEDKNKVDPVPVYEDEPEI